LRNLSRGHVQVGVEIAHLKRAGDQIDRAANRLAIALVIAALIIGSSIVMTVGGGPTLFGLPAFGLLGFMGAVPVACGCCAPFAAPSGTAGLTTETSTVCRDRLTCNVDRDTRRLPFACAGGQGPAAGMTARMSVPSRVGMKAR
jgi:hypothetical protein